MLEQYKGDILSIKDGEVANLVKSGKEYVVETKDGNKYTTKTILITTGSNRKTLDVPGAKELEHKGLTYCASCDGLFFAGLDVVVIGAGNSAFESALQLLAYCKSVTILARSENIKADALTVEAVKKDPKAKLTFNTEIVEVLGEKKVDGIKYKDLKSGEVITLPVQGIFVEIGASTSNRLC
jgi:thioredoxin reductase (NADPH)